MRVGSVSSVYYQPQCRKCIHKKQSLNESGLAPKEIGFKGNFGKIIGGAVGTSAIVVASLVAAPAIICLAGAGLVTGMVAGDVAEDKINKVGDYKQGALP